MAEHRPIIDFTGWQRADFELIANWYGVDTFELIDRVVESGAFERQRDDYVLECWEEMRSIAVEMGGKAEKPFDFAVADKAYAESIAKIDPKLFVPALSEEDSERFTLDGLALVDSDGNRFELDLVHNGFEYFVCPDLPEGERVVEFELDFDRCSLGAEEHAVVQSDYKGLDFYSLVGRLAASGNPPALLLFAEGREAAADWGDEFIFAAEGEIVPRYTGRYFDSEIKAAFDEDQDLKDLRDRRLSGHKITEAASRRADLERMRPPREEALRGYPMTALLREAYHASAALGADPTDSQLERYGSAVAELERRYELEAKPAPKPSKGILEYLERSFAEYQKLTGWQGLDAESAIRSFNYAVGHDANLRVEPPAPEHLEVATPIGTLVASSSMSYRDSQVIEVSLEKPDGSSGQVAMVEVVSGDLADGYATPLHTFCWDGNEEAPGVVVDCDHEGEFMQYVGYEHGRVSGDDVRTALEADAFKDATATPTPSVVSAKAKTAAESSAAASRNVDPPIQSNDWKPSR